MHRVLVLLSFAQMGKFFSDYGIRILFILYMVKSLQFSDAHAFGMNAVFSCLVEFGGIFGGLIADRYLGLRRSVLLGSLFLAAGYVALVFEAALFMAMGLIIAGGCLFASNISALLGLSYADSEHRRERGFTIFYMMQNFGSLVSIVICSLASQYFGFRTSFAIASLGMVVASLVLCLKRDLLNYVQEPPKRRAFLPLLYLLLVFVIGTLCVRFEEKALPILPWIVGSLFCAFAIYLGTRITGLKKFFIYLGGLVLFFAVEDQICSSLILFAERTTHREFFGWTVPSSLISSFNPVVILLFGAFIAKRRSQMLTPFILSSTSFGLLAILCLLNLNLSIFGVMGIVTAISLAELMVGPLVYSYASEIGQRGHPGLVMGMVSMAFSLALQLSGGFSKMVAIEDEATSLSIYGRGFGIVALILLGGGCILQILMKRYANEKNPVC